MCLLYIIHKNKNNSLYVLVAILCVLALIFGGYIFYDKVLSNKGNQNDNIMDNNSNENNETNNKVDNPQSIKGEINNNSNIANSNAKEYSTKTSYEVPKDFCIPTATAFVFEIKNGILTLTNKSTGESSAFENVTNFKYLEYVQLYTNCTSYAIYLLTDDGKIYESIIPLSDINDVNNLKNIFRLIELPIKVKEIGIIKNVDSPITADELLLKDENNIEYSGAGSYYSKIS